MKPMLLSSPSRGTQAAVCPKLLALGGAEPIGALKGGGSAEVATAEGEAADGGEAAEAAAADPPLWEPRRHLVPGSRCAEVAAPPCATLGSLGEFFRCDVAAEVYKHGWTMTVTAFLDYVAVNMTVEVHRGTAAGPPTVVKFQHISQDDVIQFNHLCSLALKYLSSSRLQVSELTAEPCPSMVLGDEDFDDDLLQFEEEWPVMLESAFEAISSLEKSVREQGIQALARWAELRLDCIPALLDALIEHSSLVWEALNAPLAECYPLAVTLKFASRHPEAAERLAERILPLLPWPKAGLPSLVACELEETFENLIRGGTKVGQGTCEAAGDLKDLKETPAVYEEGFSPTSTCAGDPSRSFSSGWSESSRSTFFEAHRSTQGPPMIREKAETLVLSEGVDDFEGNFL